MTIVSNVFAISLILIISMAFFKNKYFITKASRYYALCLMITLLTAVADIVFELVMANLTIPEWFVSVLLTLEYFMPILAAAILSLYFIAKVVEHIHNSGILRTAKLITYASVLVFFIFIVLNMWTGLIFDIDEHGNRADGPVWFINYVFILLLIVAVACYCISYRKSLSKTVLHAIKQSLVIIVFCIIFKHLFTDLAFLIVAIALVEGVFFLNFQNQRVGVNTLTRLNDRRRFLIELENRMHHGAKFKVYVIKIEAFDVINQVYGHKEGDEIIYLFAFALDKLFDTGVAFHMHSTTFAIVMPLSDGGDETNTISEFLKKPLKYGNNEINLTTSLIESSWSGENIDVSVFYEQLEYTISVVSDNKLDYLCYTTELGLEMLRRKYVISRLANIDREHGFEVWFQPIYNVNEGGFRSMETLLRLREPDGSMISPAEFIPIAEKTGLIIPITWFVVDEVCRALSSDKRFDGLRVSINLPMLHLLDPLFPAKVTEIVDRYAVDHGRLAFEFTERTIFDDLTTAEGNMHKLVHYGYSFYLDDFGVGYSNFNCVMQLPISTVKLDMSLTSTVESLKGNYNLVNILTDLFHDMGLTVTAEGAETDEQIELLKRYGVDNIQGYYYAKPMPIEKAAEFFDENKESK